MTEKEIRLIVKILSTLYFSEMDFPNVGIGKIEFDKLQGKEEILKILTQFNCKVEDFTSESLIITIK